MATPGRIACQSGPEAYDPRPGRDQGNAPVVRPAYRAAQCTGPQPPESIYACPTAHGAPSGASEQSWRLPAQGRCRTSPPRVRVAFEDRRTPCLGGDPVEEGGGHGCRGLLVRPGASLVQWCPGRSFPGANPMSLTYSICLTCLMYPTRSTERAGRTRSAARESPGAQERRGPSSPVLTRSPELPGSIPSDRLPRAARLPLKISPRQRRSILEGGHSNEGCCTSEACFRM